MPVVSICGDPAVPHVDSDRAFGDGRAAQQRVFLPWAGQEQRLTAPWLRVPAIPEHSAPRSVWHLLQPAPCFIHRHGPVRQPSVFRFADVQQLHQQSTRVLDVESVLGDGHVHVDGLGNCSHVGSFRRSCRPSRR